MNKKLVSLIIFSLLASATLVSAVQIPNPLGNTSDIPALLGKITTAIAGIIGSLGAVMLIVAGILYLTSAGSPERIKTAKTALIYAIVGIVIGAAASTLVTIILNIIKG